VRRREVVPVAFDGPGPSCWTILPSTSSSYFEISELGVVADQFRVNVALV
jgi:hypothetical protein